MALPGPGCKLVGCEAAEARVGAFGVVVEAPSFDDLSRRWQALEQVFVEAFNESVLGRFSRRDVVPFNAAVLLPSKNGVRRQLGAVVAHDHQRLAADGDQPFQFPRRTAPRERRVDHQRQALAGKVVDDNQHPEAPAINSRIRDEVEAPPLCGTVIGARVPRARLRPPCRRTVSASSR